MTKNWMITGTSSGFGHEIARQALERGDRVVGTVRRGGDADDLRRDYPDRFHVELLDVTDTGAIVPAVDRAVAWLGGLDVLVNNAGYGLFGAAEELGDDQIDHQIATNLRGAIQVVRAALPHLRANGGGRILQLSSIAGQSANPTASLYHATKWGIEGFSEALAGEVAGFGIGVTIVEPGSARTGFAGTGLQWGEPLPAYDGSVIRMVHGMIEDPDYTAPGDPVRMAAAMIESVTLDVAPLRLILGSDSQSAIARSLEERLEDARSQAVSAARTDY